MKNDKSKKSVHLPNHVKPTHYNLTLEPNLLSSTFKGQENITVIIIKETKQIILHSKDIDIDTVKYVAGKKEQFATKIKYDLTEIKINKELQTLTLTIQTSKINIYENIM